MADETDGGEHCKEVYARAGLALYYAQVLECGVVNAMLFARLPEHEGVSRAEIDAFLEQQFEKTLGRMLKAMRRYVTVPAELDALLTDALRKRNWLAHRFFHDFAEHFMIAKGREEMLAWLEDATIVFRLADRELAAITADIREKYGITEEAIATLVATIPNDLK